MNVNPLILELKNQTGMSGIPVVPDLYTGTAKTYVTFTYEDERPELFGNDKVLSDTAYMQINLYNPASYNYMTLKDVIKTYLESIGIVTSVLSRVYNEQNEAVRQTTFTATITKER